MWILDSEQVRELDRRAEEWGLTTPVLMENAGVRIAGEAVRLLRETSLLTAGPGRRRIAALAGKGNNGGDVLAAARHLALLGWKVQVFIAAPPGGLSGAPADKLRALSHTPAQVVHIIEPDGRMVSANTLEVLSQTLRGADLVIDGLLGIGIRGSLSGPLAAVVEIVNSTCGAEYGGPDRRSDGGPPVLAVDLPSGLDADEGLGSREADGGSHEDGGRGPCIRADVTLTLAYPKPGLFSRRGAAAAGRILVGDIGIPPAAADFLGPRRGVVTAAEAAALLPARHPCAHKGEAGRVLVVAGSRGMDGAAALCAEGALRSGAGLVCLACPEGTAQVLRGRVREIIVKELPEDSTGSLAGGGGGLNQLLELAGRCSAAVIGPGAGSGAGIRELLEALPGLGCPVILDADALNSLAASGEDLLTRFAGGGTPRPWILTPHPGEAGRLLGAGVEAVESERVASAELLAGRYRCTVVLKGAYSITAAPSGGCTVNSTGNAGMATAGSGDVLAGVIGGLAGQGMEPGDAAVLGTFIHGLAGDLASRDLGPLGMTAGDILARVPEAIRILPRLAAGVRERPWVLPLRPLESS
ncbi:MAG: NAD(P)H-hydrate dehydratase [Firmicutes bacterium]|nr:NAD(P)H-hydrate dehydratase [Bacillota bacterium]